MFYAIALYVALAVGQPNDIDIKASLSGYNLLWPSSRCCAFDFHLAADGHATVTANISSGKEPKDFVKEFKLTPDQLLQIRQAISDAAFFGLPKDICCGSPDGDRRSITITRGGKTHRVVFMDDASPAQIYQLKRARKLWDVITLQVEIPSANVK